MVLKHVVKIILYFITVMITLTFGHEIAHLVPIDRLDLGMWLGVVYIFIASVVDTVVSSK
jgi:hypothetical protein